MSLSELLFKYYNNNALHVTINQASRFPNNYARIIEMDNGYKVEPSFEFYRSIGASKTSMILDKDLNVASSDCGCLEFYRKHTCIHEIALYAIALMILDYKKYDFEYKEYQNMVTSYHHSNILKRLSDELRVSNAYFGLIHLIPVVEAYGRNYLLSLKIGYDKDYVIKSIPEFIHLVENNIEFSYGQKLSFVHSYECFDDVSKELYSFVRNITSEDSSKSIEIRKSHFLKLLEIFKDDVIFYKSALEQKPTARKIINTTEVDLILDDKRLYISTPMNSNVFISGVNHAYFIDDSVIYSYNYKSRMEGKIFDCLYKVDGGLIIDVNSSDFIANLLPILQKNVTIKKEFYERYPIPEIKVDSYLSYINNNILLSNKISCDKEHENSPYMMQLLEGYYSVIEGLYFAKNRDGIYNVCNIENQFKFLTSDLNSLKAFGEVFFDDSMKNIKAKKTSKTSVNIAYNVGLLDFSFSNSELTIEEIQAMLVAYNQKKKFVKLKDNTILKINESDAKEISDFLEDFNISVKDLTKTITKPLNYILKIVDGADNNLSVDDNILNIIKDIQNFKINDYIPSDKLNGKLREYQLEGFKWLKTLASYGFGGVLADDMGLGKTLEIINFIESDEVDMPILIVCPMSLVYNWENECDKWNVSCDKKLILGSAEERQEIINTIAPNKKIIYITSYDSLRRDVSLYKTKFRFIIADEAQFIKNQFAQKSEAIKSLNSEINFALTGTPIENGLADLWSIFDFIMPGYLSNYHHFKSRYESLILHDDTEALEKLKKRVSPFILRRTKKDVLKDLPDKIEDYYYCKMDVKQKEVYDAYVGMLKEDIKSGGDNVLAYLTRLRQICITPELIYQEPFANTKINMAVDLIRSSIESNHRILVFSQFSQSFPILSKELEKMGIKHFILDGQTKAKTRIEMVDEFNNNDEYKVFIISLKAGGTGLNLVGADMVIHMDPWWNSSAEEQATDRAYRIGQTKNVYVIKLICKDSIEEKVVKLQEVKKELAENIVHSDEQKNFKLSKQDILELLD